MKQRKIKIVFNNKVIHASLLEEENKYVIEINPDLFLRELLLAVE